MRCELEPDNFADLDCAVFEDNHPNAMALSVLVTIEMLNAMNSFVIFCYLFSVLSHIWNRFHTPAKLDKLAFSPVDSRDTNRLRLAACPRTSRCS